MSNDEQMMIDLGQLDLTPVTRRTPPGPADWIRWFAQMDAQLRRFATETIPDLPHPIWSTEAIDRVGEVFDRIFPDKETVADPANADLVDQFLRWIGECYTHYTDDEWCYSTYGPAIYNAADDPKGEGPTAVRFWLNYAAEYGFDYIRSHFRPESETEYVDDEYRRRQQKRHAAATAALQRFLNTSTEPSPNSAWDAWVAPYRRVRQLRAFLDRIGWDDLPPEPWSDDSDDVERIGALLTDWFPSRKAMVAAENADRADQVVCFLGECLIRYGHGRWFDRRQYDDMHLVHMGEKSILSLYDGFEPAIVVPYETTNYGVPFFTYVAGELLPRAVKNFADMTRFLQGFHRTDARLE